MNVYDGAELNETGARYWLAMDGWTADEAALLLLAIDPRRLTVWADVTCGKLVVAFPAQFDAQKKLIAMAFEAKALATPAPPSAVIAWAMGKGLRLPALLIPDGMVVEGGHWVKLSPAPANEAATPALAGGKNWTLKRKSRFQGYGKPLHDFLKAAFIAGYPTHPKARDVLDAWKSSHPPEVLEVTNEGLKYYDANGNVNAADLDAIRQAINRMID